MIQRITDINSYMKLTTMRLDRIRNSSIQRITSREELIEFQYLTNKSIGVRFPIEFLENANVFAVFNRKDVMCGGFALVNAQFSRVVDSLPEDAKEKLEAKFPNYINDTFEITALWLCRSQRSKSLCFRLWTRLYFETVRMGRANFIYAYSSEKVNLGKMYSLIKPTRIFKGYTNILPGMKEADHEVVEVGSVKAASMAWVTQFPTLLKKFTKSRCSKKREVYH